MKNKSIFVFQNIEMSVFTANKKHIENTVKFHTYMCMYIYVMCIYIYIYEKINLVPLRRLIYKN
jgi:hypothetical protein